MAGKQKTGFLVTLVDRSTRLVISQYCSSKSSKEVANAIITALKDLPCKSLTYDRGSEFADYRAIERALSTRTFFADPRSPWQRGSNENVNKMIRAFYPKGTDFRIFRDRKRLALLVEYINNTQQSLKRGMYTVYHQLIFTIFPKTGSGLPFFARLAKISSRLIFSYDCFPRGPCTSTVTIASVVRLIATR